MSDAEIPPPPDQPEPYFMQWIPGLIAAHDGAEAHFGRVRAVAQFHLTGPEGGDWHIVMGHGHVVVERGSHRKPSFALTLSVDTWRRLNARELDGLAAYGRGLVKLEGSKVTLFRVARLFKG